jgi:AhpD family alkylhydroperoxidase
MITLAPPLFPISFLAWVTLAERYWVTLGERPSLLAASVENSCRYCTAAHSTVLKAFMHVPAEVVSAVRSNQPLPDPKLNSLVVLTREIVSERGHVGAQTIENFLAAGCRKGQILEVLIGVALKTMSNYLDHISPAELDQAFQAEG